MILKFLIELIQFFHYIIQYLKKKKLNKRLLSRQKGEIKIKNALHDNLRNEKLHGEVHSWSNHDVKIVLYELCNNEISRYLS